MDVKLYEQLLISNQLDKMKKIYTLLAFAAILSVAGCKKADVSVETPDDETDDRVPVLFSLGQPSYDVSVKSVGGVDAWDGHELYIFGYPTDAADFTEGNALIYNVSATTTDLADPDDNGYGTSQPLTVEHTVGTGSEPFYYSADNITYDFYGYHIDDAAGEAFDKCAKVMDLGYPGGPVVDRLAKEGNPKAFTLNKPHIQGYDYSFSGLKTSFLYLLRDRIKEDPDFIEKNKRDLCASLQSTIVDILMKKLRQAAKDTGIRQVAVAGGVSANNGSRRTCNRHTSTTVVALLRP